MVFGIPGKANLTCSASWLQHLFPLHSCSLLTEQHVIGQRHVVGQYKFHVIWHKIKLSETRLTHASMEKL
mgnify:CR=1 FL=1